MIIYKVLRPAAEENALANGENLARKRDRNYRYVTIPANNRYINVQSLYFIENIHWHLNIK